MSKKKYYFESIDDTICYELSYHVINAKDEGLQEITLVEAVPDTETKDFIWCSEHAEVTERNMCRKVECESYTSKSGRGVCSHRGKLFLHGEEVKIQIH